MGFKLLPCSGKITLVNHDLASDDPAVLEGWAKQFGTRLTRWAVPCGPINGILVLDVDPKGHGFESLQGRELPPTMWQRTPSGGIHYIYRYPADGRRYGNPVGFAPGLDSRGEGGYICWYGGDGCNQPLGDAPTWFTEAVHKIPHQETSTGPTIKVSPEIAAEVILKSLEAIREAAPNTGNDVLNLESFRVGQLVRSGALTRDYAYKALFQAAKERGRPDYEAARTINSGLDGGDKKPLLDPFNNLPPVPSSAIPDPRGPSWTPSKTTREELLDFTKLRKPQLFEHWSTEDIHLTTADGGTGKTTLMLFEAICMALGDRFLGFQCKQPGKTLFITGEDTDKKLRAMKGQIIRQMGLLDDPEDDHLVTKVLESIYIKKDSDLCLIVKEQKSNFLKVNLVALEQIVQSVREIGGVKKIVFDPISSFWGSESALNDMAKAVSKFMSELVERTGACVEMINHMGKQSSGLKDMSQFSGRGGTGLPSHSRVVRTLRPIFNEEYTELISESLTDKQSAMLCHIDKFTDGSPLYKKPFLIVRDGFLFSRKSLTDSKAREAEEKLTDEERVFQFAKECREANQFPSRGVMIAHFKSCGNPIPKARVETALHMIEFRGHLGERLKLIENPDQVMGGKVYIITDVEGKEL